MILNLELNNIVTPIKTEHHENQNSATCGVSMCMLLFKAAQNCGYLIVYYFFLAKSWDIE
jgi:hypothetical protein